MRKAQYFSESKLYFDGHLALVLALNKTQLSDDEMRSSISLAHLIKFAKCSAEYISNKIDN